MSEKKDARAQCVPDAKAEAVRVLFDSNKKVLQVTAGVNTG